MSLAYAYLTPSLNRTSAWAYPQKHLYRDKPGAHFPQPFALFTYINKSYIKYSTIHCIFPAFLLTIYPCIYTL
ncbi:hypothetical protein DCM91_02640 [Chitinophaga costaii]|nr:hypothetical protein DCM91_02640 [Chitinophaga costaii]